MFTEQLKKIVDGVDGGIGGLVMGLDGIAVDSYTKQGESLDINTIGMEFSFILTQIKKAGEILEVGGVDEVAIKAEQLTIVVRMLTHEYFVAVAMRADGNFGKCRFMMRVVSPRMTAEL